MPIAEQAEVALVARRTIRAPVARVFEAWTRPEHVLRWWGPDGVSCAGAEIDLRVGGRYRIGNQLPDGKVLWIVGEFELVEPPHRLIYTWRLGPEAEAAQRVTVRFEQREEETEVVVVHELIASKASREQHERGWSGCLDGLREYLQAPS